ncbi:MAG: exopolyphosphatase [Enterobacteriaceae bacterium]
MPFNILSPQHKPREIAAIDLGSNSFHMIVARIINGSIQVLSRVKQRVQLAEGLDSKNHLSEEAMARGLNCLAMFAERLQGFMPQQVRIVATYTLRESANSPLFLKRAAAIIPYPIEIIAGQEEARLIYMGVAHTHPEKGQKLVIDIGGGSTELVIGNGFNPILAESRRMGCVSFAKHFFPEGQISEARFQQACIAASQKLEGIAWQFRQYGWQIALGASGTIKAACAVLQELGEKEDGITPERLQLLISKSLKFKNCRQINLPGLSDDRRDIFAPGLAILRALFDALHIKALYLSEGALREGVLYEMEERFRHQDIRSRTARSLAEHYNIDREQARRVLASTQYLYDQWKKQNRKQADSQLESLLRWAALLHEVGLSINHDGLQRHSAYILQNTNLPGFNQEHQLMLATLVRLHRKGIKSDDLPRFTLFKKKQYQPLVQLLRLAVLLNNQRQATTQPDSLRLITDQGHWQLIFPEDFLQQNSLLQADLLQEQQYWNAVNGWQLTLAEESD